MGVGKREVGRLINAVSAISISFRGPLSADTTNELRPKA